MPANNHFKPDCSSELLIEVVFNSGRLCQPSWRKIKVSSLLKKRLYSSSLSGGRVCGQPVKMGRWAAESTSTGGVARNCRITILIQFATTFLVEVFMIQEQFTTSWRFWLFWALTFIGFPIGASLAYALVGPITTTVRGGIAGAITGVILGAVQWFALIEKSDELRTISAGHTDRNPCPIV